MTCHLKSINIQVQEVVGCLTWNLFSFHVTFILECKYFTSFMIRLKMVGRNGFENYIINIYSEWGWILFDLWGNYGHLLEIWKKLLCMNYINGQISKLLNYIIYYKFM